MIENFNTGFFIDNKMTNQSTKDKLQMSILFVFLNLICCVRNRVPKFLLTIVLYIRIFLSMFIILLYVCITHVDFLEKQWKYLITQHDQYYPTFKVWAIFRPFVLIRHPDDLKVMKYK